MRIIPLLSNSRLLAAIGVVVAIVVVGVVVAGDDFAVVASDVNVVFMCSVDVNGSSVVDDGEARETKKLNSIDFTNKITDLYIHPNKHIDVSNEMYTNSMMFHLTLRNIVVH